MNTSFAGRLDRREAVLRAHQCPFCQSQWSIETVKHPSATILRCRRCFRVRRSQRHLVPLPR